MFERRVIASKYFTGEFNFPERNTLKINTNVTKKTGFTDY